MSHKNRLFRFDAAEKLERVERRQQARARAERVEKLTARTYEEQIEEARELGFV